MTEQANKIRATVIVPFLNAEKTLRNCVKSIMTQGAEGVEVIFINDGSTDRSMEILTDEIRKYDVPEDMLNLVVHQRRLGVAAGSTAALKLARGEYVIRCDADDEFTPGALNAMLAAAEREDADIVAAPFIRIVNDKSERIPLDKNFPDLNRIRLTVHNFSLWNKLIRRKLLMDNNVLPYEGIDCWEDLVISTRAIALAKKIVTVDTYAYKYFIYPKVKTLSRAPRDTQLSQHLKSAELLERWFNERGIAKDYTAFLNRLKFMAKVKYLRGKEKDVRAWKSTYPEINHKILGISHVALHYRILFTAVAILPSGVSQAIADWCDRFYK